MIYQKSSSGKQFSEHFISIKLKLLVTKNNNEVKPVIDNNIHNYFNIIGKMYFPLNENEILKLQF